ncbi:MAG: alpha-amylase family glycosyl hydrolase [Armatimonadota bacterium]
MGEKGREAAGGGSLRHLLPERWWEKAAGVYLCTLKPGRGYAHVLSLDAAKAAGELAEIAGQGFQAIEIFAPAEGRFGYAGLDMTDPYRVDRELGTMEDFRRFVRLAHGNGVAVVIFLNVGYFSLEAPAWLEACADKRAGRDTEKVRWFSWAESPDAPPPAAAEDRAFAAGVIPPGTADAPKTWGWQWSEAAGRYYWSRWQAKDGAGEWVGLPQTDWGREEWPQEAERIIRCWMETGIDGIIVDAPCCYSRFGWERNNRHITEVIAGYGNTYIQAEGVGDWAWITEGGYNCLQDYRLGERLEEAVRTGDPRPIEASLRGYRDLIAEAGGVLYTKVHEGGSREQRRLMAAAIASIGDTLVYGTHDRPGPDEEERWLLGARLRHPAFGVRASRRALRTNAEETHYAFLKMARGGRERVVVALSFCGAPSVVEVDLSGVAGRGLVELRSGERFERRPVLKVSLPAYGYGFYEVVG